MRSGLQAAAFAAVAAFIAIAPAVGRRNAEARRHPDLHDPGGRAAEFRRPSRDHLRHGPLDGAVLQRADPARSGASGGRHEVRLRPLHRDADADRQRHHLYVQDPRRREVARRFAAHRGRRGGELEPHHPSAARLQQRARQLVPDGRHRLGARRHHRGVPPEVRHAHVPAGARRSVCLHLQEGHPRQGPELVHEEHHGQRAVQVRRPTTSASRSRASAIPTTTTRACPISTASSASSPTSRWCAPRRSAPIARRPSSAACRPRRSISSRRNSATRSPSRPATGTAAT